MPDPIWDADALVARYDEVRAHTEALAAPLSPEDQTVQSMPDVSPTKWHRAHVTWFFETFVLADHEPSFTPYQDQYWFLFNSYYEGVGPRYARAERGFITRPGAHDVGLYRADVDARMRDLVDRPSTAARSRSSRRTIELGFHHEQQHQELLLMDIKHVLSVNPLQPVVCRQPRSTPSDPDPLGWVDVEGGLVEVGHRGGGLQLRQRAAAAPAVARALPPRRPPRHQRRVARVHGRPRLRAARAVALRRLGAGCAPRAGARRSTGPRSTAPGSSTR